VELTAGVALFALVDLKVPGVEDSTKAVVMGCKAPAKPGGIPEDGTAAGPVDCCKRVADTEPTAGVVLLAPADLKVPGVEEGTKAVLMGCKAPAKPGGIPEGATAAGPVDCCEKVVGLEPTAGVVLLAPVDLNVPGAEDGINGN
jgi:hypothetical protein